MGRNNRLEFVNHCYTSSQRPASVAEYRVAKFAPAFSPLMVLSVVLGFLTPSGIARASAPLHRAIHASAIAADAVVFRLVSEQQAHFRRDWPVVVRVFVRMGFDCYVSLAGRVSLELFVHGQRSPCVIPPFCLSASKEFVAFFESRNESR